MIAQLAAEAARGGENPPVCEERDGLDSPEYVDIFYEDTFGESVGCGWSKSRGTDGTLQVNARSCDLVWMCSAQIGSQMLLWPVRNLCSMA